MAFGLGKKIGDGAVKRHTHTESWYAWAHAWAWRERYMVYFGAQRIPKGTDAADAWIYESETQKRSHG